jgi:hypothetical protein
MLTAELNHHLANEAEVGNHRNGSSKKTVLAEYSHQSGQRFSRQVGHLMARQTGHLFSYPDIKFHYGVNNTKVRLRPIAALRSTATVRN